uniref:Coiled-coil domain containing 27 n=1 Tax=Serinus canaria TaxID=9135 RepID=A0A8C9L5Q1_SERCA
MGGDHAVASAGSSGDEEGGMGDQGGHVEWQGQAQAQAGVGTCRAEETEIREYPELEGTHKDHQIQLLRRTPCIRTPSYPQGIQQGFALLTEIFSDFTGAISSLQRQMEIQESELRKIRSEKELLQKQLRLREVKLQAVSNRVRPKKAVMMMEERNYTLQEVNPFRLAEQDNIIHELERTNSQLQAEVVTTRRQFLEQKQAQRETQSKCEALQQTELQTRVFERYRNKIIQATFSVEGSQDPQGELTDDDVLEAMQVCGSSRQLPGVTILPKYKSASVLFSMHVSNNTFGRSPPKNQRVFS